MIETLLEEYDYAMLNTGKPTFQKFDGGMFCLDIALVNSIASKCNW